MQNELITKKVSPPPFESPLSNAQVLAKVQIQKPAHTYLFDLSNDFWKSVS